MTGYTVHTGSTVKFSGGWDHIFSGQKAAKGGATPSKKAAKKAATKAKKSTAKGAGKKARGKKHG